MIAICDAQMSGITGHMINFDLKDVQATAQAINCDCMGSCNRAEAVQCLYTKTLDLLSRDDEDWAARLDLLRPLAMVAGFQKTREGQRECAAYAANLAADDAPGALAACRRLIELDAELAAK